MNKQEILRKHLGQTEAEFQDLGKKNTLDAMEEYAELYHQAKVKNLGLFSVMPRYKVHYAPSGAMGKSKNCMW